MIGHLESGKFLHHYTSIEKALNILSGGQLWLSPVTNVNDPKEFSNWNLNHFGQSEVSFDEWKTISNEISQECKSITKLACFSNDTKTEHQSGFDRYIDIGCIGRGFANSPMWHFYGNEHEGCCLMFDKERLINEFIKQTSSLESCHGDVQYIDEYLARDIHSEPYCFDLDRVLGIGVKQYSKEFIESRLADLYMKKQSVWNYENEYRFIVVDDDKQPFKLNFNHALSFICFGVETTDRDKKAIQSLSSKNGFDCREIKFSNQSIQLVM